MNKRATTTISLAVGAGALLAIALPLSASAHVTITPYTTPPGAYALITFKVPNESATAGTKIIEVDIPTDTPFASVSYVPVPGWDVTLVTEQLPKPVKIAGNQLKEAVTKVIWTAQPGHEIGDGQLQLLPLSVGPVPNTGKILLPMTQTYTDGTVVGWSDKTSDAAHPAPVLYVKDAPIVSPDADAEVTAASQAQSRETTATSPVAASSDPVARGLGIGGLVLGAIGLALGAVGIRRTTASKSDG
ncbi:MAG: hypothetical protein JWN09_1023 [Microbacteriaceae bacterium]|jgi:uncharacterized protein YcnI|nr:hypothetical protein [Microbacteriaceae bacterium]